MKENMINKIAKEAYVSCFKDIYSMKESNDEMMDAHEIEAHIQSQVKEYQAKKQIEDSIRKDINADALKAYEKVFGNEQARGYECHNSYNEWMAKRNHFVDMK